MNEIWNEIELKIPPLITLRVADVGFVKQVRSIFIKRKTLENDTLQSELANNAALLSRLMARRKNSFHNMSGFKFVCKLNAALCRLLKLDVEQVLSNFFQMLPEVLVDQGSENQVPSRSCFDYILLRIISVHKLYERIAFCCRESADYFEKVLRNNFFMETITLFLAVIAKLWDISNKLGNMYSDHYGNLVALRNCFPQTDSSNYFKNVNFPKQLDRFWIPNSSVDEDDLSTNVKKTITILKDVSQSTPVAKSFMLSKTQKSEDIGMPISRDSLKPKIDLGHIHNVDDVHRFFKEEDENRKKSLNSCVTKYILKHEWLGIQKLVERKIIANDHKKALSVFKKFITSKI